MGRKTLLTEDIRTQFTNYLMTGVSVETAAAACGMNRETMQDWLRRGRKEINNREANEEWQEEEEPYVLLVQEADRAIARLKIRLTGNIIRAGDGYEATRSVETYVIKRGKRVLVDVKTVRYREADWRASMKVLERRFPKEYGEHQIHDSGDGSIPVVGITVIAPPEAQRDPGSDEG